MLKILILSKVEINQRIQTKYSAFIITLIRIIIYEHLGTIEQYYFI